MMPFEWMEVSPASASVPTGDILLPVAAMTAAPRSGACWGLSGRVTNSRHGLEDQDTTVLLGVVVTPVVGIR
jgi:hypothetical protein